MLNYIKIYRTITDRKPRVVTFNDANRLARVRALGQCQVAKRAAVYRRPDDLWKDIPQVGEARRNFHPVAGEDPIPEVA